ncbi:MAG: DotU family type IV/VI secretion system protein [Holosporaceae bacterium]|jgi:type VI secretion system protein ImpK|nr:DotU family type IV/VI secretion system protein [Holosporaceae bacterium]
MQNTEATSLVQKFLNFCLEVFSRKKSIENDDNDTAYKEAHKSIDISLKSFLNSATIHAQATAKDVAYAMAAIADEIFLNTKCAEGKKYWEENMLEQRYFGSLIAGEEIFNKINTLVVKSEPFSLEKAEIYLKTLALGFKGKYRGSEDENLEIGLYKKKLFDYIEKNDKSIFIMGYRLFQKEYTYTIPTIHRKLLPDASIVNYISAFFVFMFLVISSAVWMFETRDIKQLLNDISFIALRK